MVHSPRKVWEMKSLAADVEFLKLKLTDHITYISLYLKQYPANSFSYTHLHVIINYTAL